MNFLNGSGHCLRLVPLSPLSAGYTQPDTALLRRRQRGLGALASEACFQLRDGGHLRQDELAHRTAHLGQVSK